MTIDEAREQPSGASNGADEEAEEHKCFSFRWGIPLLDGGYTDVPNFFFDHYIEVGVTRMEFLTILHLARYRFEREGTECRPSVATVAEQMGYTERAVQKILAGLEERGLLQRCFRPGDTTLYDFAGFSQAMLARMGGEPQFTPTPEPQFTPGVNPNSPEEEHTRNGEGGLTSDQKASLSMLLDFGVAGPVARELATTCALGQVEGWVTYAAGARSLQDPPALVVARLQAGEPVPASRPGSRSKPEIDSEERCRRYIGGEFGDLIEC